MRRILLWTVLLTGSPLLSPAEETSPSKSSWAQEAIWYQIFPERFRNGDPKNDPTADYARVPDQAKAEWKIVPWTKDWYALEDWEKKLGSDVYATNGFRRFGFSSCSRCFFSVCCWFFFVLEIDKRDELHRPKVCSCSYRHEQHRLL